NSLSHQAQGISHKAPLVSHPHSGLRGTPTNLHQRFIASTLSSQWSYAHLSRECL
ncbi:hypothetical protein L0F63_005073, partial [Massospora cicadina]